MPSPLQAPEEVTGHGGGAGTADALLLGLVAAMLALLDLGDVSDHNEF